MIACAHFQTRAFLSVLVRRIGKAPTDVPGVVAALTNTSNTAVPYRPRVKFLTVVWGAPYIRRFAALSLPSFLAPGNLPALAASTELEVLIMTRRCDIDLFKDGPAFRRLRDRCAVRFVEIDDLVTTGVYGVTLTLAYARPVIASGSEMLSTHFVFMNADFVLADGSLASLCRHIVAGRSIVLGPSFRATAEAVEPGLLAEINKDSGVLALSPRQLASMALPYPHPTTVAKFVDQELCHSVQPNQFFWRVDDRTLLGRYFLIFMLCLKPERIIASVNSFCDYSFVPELCPSGDEVAMTDSDDFFMLELQLRGQEQFMLRLGKTSERAIARSLAVWTTTEHRRAARHDIIFHSADIPQGIEAAKADAQAFIERMVGRLGNPVSHDQHPFWIGGIDAWRQRRRAQGLSAWPPELGPPSHWRRLVRTLVRGQALPARDSIRSVRAIVHTVARLVQDSVRAMLYMTRRVALGHWPNVSPLHPAWADARHLRLAIGKMESCQDARVLVVRTEPDDIDSLLETQHRVRFATMEQIAGELDGLVDSKGQFAHVLIYSSREVYPDIRALLQQSAPLLTPDGVCEVFVHRAKEANDLYTFNSVIDYVDEILPGSGWALECTFVGGSFGRLSRRLQAWASLVHTRFGVKSLPLSLTLIVPALAFALSSNALSYLLGPRSRHVAFCSSALLRFRRRSD